MFKACLKKEFLEAKRTKNFYMILGIAVSLALFVIFTVTMISLLQEHISAEQLGDFAFMFESGYGSSSMYFSSFMSTYFMIIVIIFFCGTISKEINSKQWILPINSGVKPRNLIGAKIVSSTITVTISYIFAALTHFILTVLLVEKAGLTNMYLVRLYLYLLIFTIFITIMLVSLNAITKNRWLPVTISLLTLIVLPELFASINIGGHAFVTFTPLGFYSIVMNSFNSIPTFTFLQWFCMSASTIIISVGLIIWALHSTKIKAEKTNKFINKFKFKKNIKDTI